MATKYAKGDVIEYTVSGSAVTSGDVVELGNTVGVIVRDAAVGETAVLAIEGAYTVTAGGAITVGAKVAFDGVSKFIASASDVVGIALTSAAADGDPVVIKLER